MERNTVAAWIMSHWREARIWKPAGMQVAPLLYMVAAKIAERLPLDHTTSVTD